MNRFRFDSKDSAKIVTAIIEGYREYIEHRLDRKAKMHISSAFAWTKGNFIESKIAEHSSDLKLSYKTAKAGLSWDYLQFSHKDSNILFLIKNAHYFNPDNFSYATLPTSTNRTGTKRTYLHELSQINNSVDFPDIAKINRVENTQQLSFFVSEQHANEDLQNLKREYDEFHILTYEIDKALQISKIIHYLPNPQNNIAYEIEDLSRYIAGAELTDEERSIIAPEQEHDIIDPAAFDIGILDKENKASN